MKKLDCFWLDKINRVCPKCGHKKYEMKFEREICRYCGHWVYKSKKIEFKYKLKEAMRK